MNLHMPSVQSVWQKILKMQKAIIYAAATGYIHRVFAGDAKCGRLCLTLGGDSCLWYESIAFMGNDWDQLQGVFHRQLSKLANTQE